MLDFVEINSVEIKNVDSETVYDLEVEENHSYNIEGVIVHNSVCTTRLQTGFTCPQFTAVQRCSKVSKVPVIADGGVKNVGDISKALVAGASMVMAGGFFSGCDETPGKEVEINGQKYKEYFGSASSHNKGHRNYIEGKKILTPLKGPVGHIYDEIKDGIQSSISYAGGTDISAFNTTEYVTK